MAMVTPVMLPRSTTSWMPMAASTRSIWPPRCSSRYQAKVRAISEVQKGSVTRMTMRARDRGETLVIANAKGYPMIRVHRATITAVRRVRMRTVTDTPSWSRET